MLASSRHGDQTCLIDRIPINPFPERKTPSKSKKDHFRTLFFGVAPRVGLTTAGIMVSARHVRHFALDSLCETPAHATLVQQATCFEVRASENNSPCFDNMASDSCIISSFRCSGPSGGQSCHATTVFCVTLVSGLRCLLRYDLIDSFLVLAGRGGIDMLA